MTNEPQNENNIADSNVERLLGSAYEPVTADSDFVATTTQRMLDAAAQTQSDETIPEPLAWPLPRVLLAWSAVAAVMLLGVSLLFNSTGEIRRDGEVVWIGDKAYVLRGSEKGDGYEYVEVDGKRKDQAQQQFQFVSSNGLIPRKRPDAPKAALAKTGDTIETTAGQRRRVVLPDGSVLYINQNTRVQVGEKRDVFVSNGEVFVEVAQQTKDGKKQQFVVTTPQRKITALGTKFDVAVDDEGTGVIVTQGRVSVSPSRAEGDAAWYLAAGQQLLPDKTKSPTSGDAAPLAATPRFTHVLDWTRELVAAAQSPLVPKSKHAGGALICVDPHGQETRLELRKFHVDVHIENGFARTSIDQTYFNHENWRQEGTFYFPLPADASLSRLAMYVDDKLMEGGMAERNYARQVFDSIVSRQKDPALLEWVDGSTFKMRVFPLEAREEKRIIISYTQKLNSLYERTDYRFPGGHNLGLVRDWSVNVRVKDGGRYHWDSPSHNKIKSSVKDGDLVLTDSAKHIKPDKDVVLRLYPGGGAFSNADAKKDPVFAMAEHEGAKYLMFKYRPDLLSEGTAISEGRDYVFLFEASGNRDSLLARVQVDIIKTMLENAEHNDTFNIITAGTRTQVYSKMPQLATPQNVDAAIDFLENTHLVGALDLGKAIDVARPLLNLEAYGDVDMARWNPHLVHVGTAVPTLGERQVDVLVKRIPKAVTYVGIGVGKRWSRQFMKTAASNSGGLFTQINPDENIHWRAYDLLATLNTPRYHKVRVVDGAEKVTFLSFNDVVTGGEDFMAVARIGKDQPMPSSVIVTGVFNGETRSEEIAVGDVKKRHSYLPRTWAKLEIDRMLAEDAAKNKQKIIEFSKKMYVMSPFTSLLVLENEAMYEQFKVDRGRKDHWALYPAPDTIEVVFEPDPENPIQQHTRDRNIEVKQQPEAPKKKPTAQNVLNTIVVRVPVQMVYWPNRQHHGGGHSVTALQAMTGNYAIPSRGWWGGRNEWSLRYYDFDGRKGMNTWAKRHGLMEGQAQQTERGEPSAVREPSPSKESVDMLSSFQSVLRPVNGRFSGDRQFGFITDGRRDTSIRLQRDGWLGASGLTHLATSPVDNAQTILFDTSTSMDFEDEEDLSEEMSESFAVTGGVSFGRNSESLRTGTRGNWGLYGPGLIQQDMKKLSEYSVKDEKASPEFIRGRRSRRALSQLQSGQFASQLISGRARNLLLYQRPSFSANWLAFGDLVQYAPGMNTTMADIRAVLDAEAEQKNVSKPGKVDKAAKQLIDRARGAGWRGITFKDEDGKALVTVTFDGTGRYAYERRLPNGLNENVVCDGATLWHMYSDIGVGSKRTYSRFHRAELAQMIPWILPRTEDLALGSDILKVDDDTVAIVASGAAGRKDKEGKPVPYFRIHLVFGDDGSLAERHLVKMPAKEMLGRQVYASDGTITMFDKDGKEVSKHKHAMNEAVAPQLKPDTKKLVVLPLPYRTRNHVWQQYKLNDDYRNIDDAAAMALIGANFTQRQWDTRQVIAQRYFSRGDRRIGFYTLMIASNQNWVPDTVQSYSHGIKLAMNPVKDHPNSPLAKYAFQQLELNRRGYSVADLSPTKTDGDGFAFLNRMAEFRYLTTHWISGKARSGSSANRQKEYERIIKFIRNSKNPVDGWAIMAMMYSYGGGDQKFHAAMYDVLGDYEKFPGLNHIARYERARALYSQSKYGEARQHFTKLYRDQFDEGRLPRIEHYFYYAFTNDNKGGRDAWRKLMEEVSNKLIDKKNRAMAVYHAWQIYQVGDQTMAEKLFANVLANVPKDQHLPTLLASIEYLWHTNQQARAEVMIETLLADKRYNKISSVWRLGAAIGARRQKLARSLACQEKAIEIEFANLPDIVNLRMVRNEFSQLLNQYQQLAAAIATLEQEPPAKLVQKIVNAADRWRVLDTDDTAACQSAARILNTIGAKELAWDYLTTPLADQPNESSPWTSLAVNLRNQGEFNLADRAYATAFDIEPTNAQILWDRAHLKMQLGQVAEAQKLFGDIANGKWDRRFNWMQQQARRHMN